MAVATDVKMEMEVPVFGLEDVEQLANFIEKKFLSRMNQNHKR